MRGLLVVPIALGILVSCSSIPSGSPAHNALIEEFIDKSFLRQEVMQLSTQYGELQKTKVGRTGSEAEMKALELNREMDLALRPETTVPLMREYLRTQRPDILAQLVAWLGTPLAQRMGTLATAPFDVRGFSSYQVPKDGLLYELVPRLDKAAHTSEVAIQEATERTKLLGPMLMEKGKTIPSDYQLSPQIAQFLEAQVLRKQAFMYRTASGMDLRQYVEFLESPLGQAYVVLRRNAFVAAHSKLHTVIAKVPTLAQSLK